MLVQEISYKPVRGKTYSLFGSASSSYPYYKLIENLANICLQHYDIKTLLFEIQKASGRMKFLKKLVKNNTNNSIVSFVLNTLRDSLRIYTTEVDEHLRRLSIFKIWDRRLGTTEEQYHLYMLEIELINRINKENFKKCEHKIALLPYCLQDFQNGCKSTRGDIDYICKGCSGKCFINRASRILRNNDITPYIWMSSSIKAFPKLLKARPQSIGILGIACIPELVWGMRMCMHLGIPVVGMPLDANRCMRWMGKFHENSVNLEKLNDLLSAASENKQQPLILITENNKSECN
jgi:hypothetical protein